MNITRPIVITGISSFVGAHLGRFLARRGNTVIGTHSRPRMSYGGLEAERLIFAEEGGVKLETLDLADEYGSEALIRKHAPIYWISHAGWTQNHTSDSYDIEFGHVTQIASYDTIFKALAEVGCKGVVSTGSSAEYVGAEDGCDEDDFRWPTQPYGLVKLTKTIRFQQLAARHHVPVRIARLFNPFGTLEGSARFVSAVTETLISGKRMAASDPLIERDFIHIDDLCTGYLALLNDCRRDIPFDIFNLCGGEPIPLGAFVEKLAGSLGVSSAPVHFHARPIRLDEPSILFGQNEKARLRLGWTPTPLEQALELYAADYRTWRSAPTAPSSTRQPLIRLSRSSISACSIRCVSSALHRGFLGMGADTEAFENELRAYLGGKVEVICVNTGTSALHLALQACGIGPGDEVLVPTLTFVASFQAISATGAKPIACDVRESDGYLCLADAEKRLTPNTKAIMPVHYAGSAKGLAAVAAFAEKHNLRVIEDAAHAFGGSINGQKVGSFGDIVCFSFDGIKNITSGEGGAIVTSDPVIAERVRDARLLGIVKDTEKRYAGQRSWDFDVTEQGWRYHMSNINAALGRAQLHRLDSEFAPRRRELSARYRAALTKEPGIRLFEFAWEEMVPHIFPIRVLNNRRDAFRAALTEANIETGIHYKPNHLLSFYKCGSLPIAEVLYAELLTLPLHAELTGREQARVIETLKKHIAS